MSDIILPRSAGSLAHAVRQTIGCLEAPPPLVELLPVAVYACDADGRLLWFNQKAAELWGRTPRLRNDGDRFSGFFKGYVGDREVAGEETLMAEVLRAGMAVDAVEASIERPDGNRIWVTLHIEPVYDEDGTIVGAINCFHDATAAHDTLETLQQRQKDLEDFFENGAVALHLVGEDGTILRANQAELDLLGYRPEEYVGRNISEFHIDPPVIGEILSRLCTGKKLDKYPARLRAKDGSIKHVLITSNVQFRADQFVNTRCFTIDVTEWKRAEQVLSESEQRFAATYEHAAIGISEVDAQGRRLRVNEAACRITGRTREEMLGAVVFDTLHPDDREDDASQHRLLVAGKIDRYAIEKRYIRRNGDVAWLSVMCSALRDEAGEFLYSVRVFHDISEAKRAVHALAESEQRLAATYEHAAIAISEIDANGRLIRVNETACAITGYPRDELLGLSVFDLTHPDDRNTDSTSYRRQASDDAGPYAVEKRLFRKNGETIWVSVVSSSVRDSAGRFLYGIRVMQDITARKRAEDMVRDSEQQLRQVLEALPAAVYTTDAAGHVKFYNQAAVELSGRRPDVDADKWCVSWRLYDPEGRPIPHDQCPMAIALKEDRQIRGQELIVERSDGTIASVVPYPTPLHDGSGALVGAVNMLVDITERKHAEARQKTLIDELNHRVKNTLATVQSLAGQTLRGTNVAAKVRDSLTARLFALSKTHDHLSRAGWESADFKSIVTDIFAPFQIDADNQVRLDGPSVRLPPNGALLLGMVLHELATNAAKYGALSRATGTLDVNWTVEGGAAGRRLAIDWQEAGGPRVRKPERRGFGSRLAERAITSELKGSAQMSFDPSGLQCKFEIPLGVSTT